MLFLTAMPRKISEVQILLAQYQQTMKEGVVGDCENLATRFLVSLEPSIRKDVHVALHGKGGGGRPRSVEEVVHLAAAMQPQDERVDFHDADQVNARATSPRRSRDSSPRARYSRRSSRDSRVRGDERVHRSERRERREPSRRRKKELTELQRDLRDRRCTYCKKQWDTEHRCEEYIKSKKAKREQKRLNRLERLAETKGATGAEKTSCHPEEAEVARSAGDVLADMVLQFAARRGLDKHAAE
ncbi:hypothetical protein BX666DRAFT_1671566 [Dichotomocladium elegans]|nr:hypothetical protein BX666DRAFT_1671566 [Dichotomocladium elegans]